MCEIELYSPTPPAPVPLHTRQRYGVPIEPSAEHGFAYPKERKNLRLCRGYLNALKGLTKRMEPSIWNCGDE